MAAMLAPMLGWDKAVEVVASAVRRLNLKEGELGPDERKIILEDLSMETGLVGVTARYVLSRGGISTSGAKAVTVPPSAAPQSAPPSSPRPAPESSAAARLAATVGVHEVVAQLAVLLGQDRTETIVLATLKRLGLPRERLDREQATRLLDELGRQEGHLGSSARFVKPRVLGRFGA
jgi:hypothetical protein